MVDIDRAARVALLVPDSTKQNYRDLVRRAAVQRGVSIGEASRVQVEAWRQQHLAEPLGGFDVLADWLDSEDLGVDDAPDPNELAKARALESLKRDPQHAVLDQSDRQVREEIELARNAANSAISPQAPVVTPDGVEVAAADVAKAAIDGVDSVVSDAAAQRRTAKAAAAANKPAPAADKK